MVLALNLPSLPFIRRPLPLCISPKGPPPPWHVALKDSKPLFTLLPQNVPAQRSGVDCPIPWFMPAEVRASSQARPGLGQGAESLLGKWINIGGAAAAGRTSLEGGRRGSWALPTLALLFVLI